MAIILALKDTAEHNVYPNFRHGSMKHVANNLAKNIFPHQYSNNSASSAVISLKKGQIGGLIVAT